MVRESAVFRHAPFMLNLDCDALENQCAFWWIHPQLGKKLCYVQFPQNFGGIDQYANGNNIFLNIYIYIYTTNLIRDLSEKRKKMTCDCWLSSLSCCCDKSFRINLSD
ncbi:unnamed protein product [Microthlaspi erraticum]|uniref:Uncharacterized protein n=1 Tax=Microthlaspi erraticum TaxID=1685480 RepID=A0A6D2IXS7_9BRAS|nr:unnamed protein product [Microthlaspi erraticum]